MNAFDKVIGYSEIKQELIQIADTLKNAEIYQAMGASSPQGLLLYGVPGVGKSLMAKCLMDVSERKVFTCRKTEPNGEFVKTIKDTFDRAAENVPSIVFLDDMDKFANDDDRHCDSEEFVTVQSCIDEVKGREVFVLATANAISKLPRSLVRTGRFDRMIEVEAPDGKNAEKIIRHYLSRKKLADDLDVAVIAGLLEGRSCADLETVINEASLLAGYQRAEKVAMKHITEACLRIVFNLSPALHIPIDLKKDSRAARTVYHEAGHAAIAELVDAGCVQLVVARQSGEACTGVTRIRKEDNLWTLRLWEREIMISLAGRAATEVFLGEFDTGATRDLDNAFEAVQHLIQDHCYIGFDLYCYCSHDNSGELSVRQEAAIAAEIEHYYRRVKGLLRRNKEFFNAIAQELAEKGVLTASNIRDIRKSCRITEAAG